MNDSTITYILGLALVNTFKTRKQKFKRKKKNSENAYLGQISFGQYTVKSPCRDITLSHDESFCKRILQSEKFRKVQNLSTHPF